MGDRYSNCEELFDDDGEPVCDGDMVEVNGSYVGKVHVSEDGKFQIEGWPDDAVIHSLIVRSASVQ